MKTRRRKTQRRRKLRGGNEILHSLPNDYEQIYVGIGAKWHDLNYDEIGELYDTEFPGSSTISISQLVPSFLEIGKKTLILIIDIFTPEQLVETKRIINIYNSNFDVRIINSLFDKSIKTQLVNYLQQNSSLMWICNFVKYYNSPNPTEKENRDSVEQLFDEIITDPKFADCTYDWIKMTKYLIKHKMKHKLEMNGIKKTINESKHILSFV